MKHLKMLIMALAIAIVSVSSTYSFDGNRKGFVLGGGIGFSPVSSFAEVGRKTENQAGIGLQFVIGGAWDEVNIIAYEGNVTGYIEDSYSDRNVAQGFNGAVWYHYFGTTGRAPFTALGMGLYYFKVQGRRANDLNYAFLVGGGYEFARHLQLGAYLSYGRTSRGSDVEHFHLNLLVSAIAF